MSASGNTGPPATPETAKALQSDPESVLDLTCEHILESAAPLRVEPARSAAERDAAHHLRYQCVVDEGWADASEFPDAAERDAYDDHAVQLCAWEGSELAGVVRLVVPCPGLTLPIEKEFGVKLDPPGEVVDGGRLVLAPKHRAELSQRVLAALFSRCWLIAREQGLRRFASAASDRVIRLYRHSGMRIEVLGEPRTYWGEERRPFLLTGADPAAFFRRARARPDPR